MNILLGGLMIGASLAMCRRGSLGTVPKQIWSNIRSERSQAEKDATMRLDCDDAFRALARGYRQLLRAQARVDTDKEQARLERMIESMDRTAKVIDDTCDWVSQ